jgi:Ca2+-binding EF-hand superfamily protein
MRAVFLVAVIAFAPAVASAQEPCTGDAQRVVDAIYRQVLERPADGQAANLVTQLSNGQATVREAVRSIAKSPEHRQRFLAGSTNARAEAVTYIYRHVLGREPDPNGLNTYVQRLSNGDPNPIIDSLINSPEYQQNYGNDTVPGARLRYCRGAAPSSAANSATGNRFAGLDRNGNGTIERQEWNGNRGSFDVQDWNGDGVLSGEEVRPGARRAARAAEEAFNPAEPATWTELAFRRFDRNRDNRLTSTEWFHDATYFRRADRNRDGALVLSEFTTTAATASTEDRGDRILSLDVNRNNRVERNEWRGTVDAFEWLDENNDNVLSRAELGGEDGTTDRVDAFASLDANRNGTLSIQEWRWSRRSFNRSDGNADGVISRQEFEAGGGAPTVASDR